MLTFKVSTQRRARIPLAVRREQILAAALVEFGHKGLHGGSTVAIARDIDISHPNLFRIYPTKHELFVAVLKHVFERVEARMLSVGESAEENPLDAMSDAWGVLMQERDLMFMILQGYAASDDDNIRDIMREWTREVFERVEVLPGVGEDGAHDFIAQGMFYMAAAAMDLPARGDAWAARFLASGA